MKTTQRKLTRREPEWLAEAPPPRRRHQRTQRLEAVRGDQAARHQLPEAALRVRGQAPAGPHDVVIKEGATYLRIVALCEVFLGAEIVLEGAFGGAGNSVPPMLISVIFTWLRIPLSLFLANHLGLGSSGVWWAISLTTGIKGALMALWFRLGRWKSKKV